jgi:hypothetical protein
MTLNEQIRKSLRECGAAMTLDQLTDANDWTKEERAQACKNLSALRKTGEVQTSMDEGKACFALDPAFRRVQSRGPGIHFANGDGGRAPPEKDVRTRKTAEVTRVTTSDRAGKVSLEISTTARISELLHQLVATGLHGCDQAEAAERLIAQGLESLIERKLLSAGVA